MILPANVKTVNNENNETTTPHLVLLSVIFQVDFPMNMCIVHIVSDDINNLKVGDLVFSVVSRWGATEVTHDTYIYRYHITKWRVDILQN